MPGQAKDGSATAPYTTLNAQQIATLTAEAEGWQPKDGDEIDGVVLAIKSAYSEQKGRNYPIVFVYTTNGKCTAVHCFQTVLENEMKSQRPLPGEPIYIKRIGEDVARKKPGQNATIRYAVQVTREAHDSDPWAHLS